VREMNQSCKPQTDVVVKSIRGSAPCKFDECSI
jgi:hypothetical protein